MAMKIYRWHGSTFQIADDDLDRYPGAELIAPKAPAKAPVKAPEKKAEVKPEEKSEKKPPSKKKKAPANKSRQPQNK